MWSTKRFFILLVFFSICSCAIRSSSLRAQYDKRVERIEKEKEKLKKLTDPVDRTKTQIRIAELLLSFVADSVNAGDQERMEQRLDEYVAAVQDAHQAMARTGRDAHKKPKGFKDLEIALRRQVRQLEDIGQGLSFDRREPVEKAKAEASMIRDQLLKALFGEQNAPSRKG